MFGGPHHGMGREVHKPREVGATLTRLFGYLKGY